MYVESIYLPEDLQGDPIARGLVPPLRQAVRQNFGDMEGYLERYGEPAFTALQRILFLPENRSGHVGTIPLKIVNGWIQKRKQ